MRKALWPWFVYILLYIYSFYSARGIRGGMTNNSRVLVVADNTFYRIGLCEAINYASDLELVGEAINGFVALKKNGELRPDVVLLDFRASAQNAFEYTRLILKEDPSAKIIIFSDREDEEGIRSAKDAGACGYISNSGMVEDMMNGIRLVASGKDLFPELEC